MATRIMVRGMLRGIARLLAAGLAAGVTACAPPVRSVAGEWTGAIRASGSWHAARLRLEQTGSTVAGKADVAGLNLSQVPVTGALEGSRLSLRVAGGEVAPLDFQGVRERDAVRTDPGNIRGPSLTMYPSVALPSSLAAELSGWYVSDTGDTVVVTPGSEGGLRFFGLGRLSGTLLRRSGDEFGVAWMDQVPTVLRTDARFTRDAQGGVTGFELGDEPAARHTALKRIESPRYRQRQVEFASGDVTLKGTVFAPADSAPHPAVVFIHGTGHATADRAYEMSLVDGFLSRGVGVLMFDKRGAGRSTGDWRTSSLQDLAGDVAAATRFLRRLPGVAAGKVGVYGISEGGWIAPIAAQLDPEIAFVVNQGGPAVAPLEDELDDLMAGVARLKLAAPDTAGAMELIRALVELYRSPAGFPRYSAALAAVSGAEWFQPVKARLPVSEDHWEVQWWRKRARYNPADAWTGRRAPALVLIGENDDTMDVRKSAELFRTFNRRGAPLEVRIVPGADHGLRVRGALTPGFPASVADWILSAAR